MVYSDKKTTISYEDFLRIPLQEDSLTKSMILETFDQSNDPTIHRIENNTVAPVTPPTKGYALSVGATDISKKLRNTTSIPDLKTTMPDQIDMKFIRTNHDFYKRADESVEETLKRTEKFISAGGMHYVVQEASGDIIGTINGMKKGNTAAIFSYMVLPKRRKKGVGALLGGSMHNYLLEQGVTTLWAKTKNKYVYYLLTRGYGGEVLRKELYY